MIKTLFECYDEEATVERCGFILKDGTVLEAENVHPNPEKGFEIDPLIVVEQIDEVIGVWHTHPKANSVLSGEDKLCFEQWPNLDHYVIGNDGVRLYQVVEGVVIDADYASR